jgi:hypothetical protein
MQVTCLVRAKFGTDGRTLGRTGYFWDGQAKFATDGRTGYFWDGRTDFGTDGLSLARTD